ncbi:TadE family protein [Celeribacter litoreus]|uniref:TadE family protein n=1 Tax=Celeribacter litoreus TaxID=2876714 RepID=UPI0029625397|nr:pilus assembly protein [Celeribacter litoreus]
MEALLAMPIVLIVLAAMFEFGALMFQWNMTVKATQIGARMAAVSTPLVGEAEYDAAMQADFGTLIEGEPVPAAKPSISCGAGFSACKPPAAMTRLLTGGDGICGEVSDSSVIGMCDVAPFLGAENVRITYQRSGLGYVGRPYGQISTVTVEAVDLTFDFFLLDSLIPALGNIPIPAHPAAITSEDLNDCKDSC